MPEIDFAALTTPVSQDEPCGPDLELAGDADYMHFVARVEGLLPASFLSHDAEGRLVPFDRTSIDIPAEVAGLGGLLASTRDLRLLVLLAKLLVLNRDLGRFSGCLSAIAALLAERWGDVHPAGEDGDFTMRCAALQTLDDMPTVVMPLQHVPIAHSRRFGAVSYRGHLVASGAAEPREGEDAPGAAAIEAAFSETPLPDLVATRDALATLRAALAGIRLATLENAGAAEAVSFERLSPLADAMFKLLDEAVARRDPDARSAPPAEPHDSMPSDGMLSETSRPAASPRPAAGTITSPQAAAAALAAAAAYFRRAEPSNPAILLVGLAQELIGKSFAEVVRILMPDLADRAAFNIGSHQVFELPLERLAGLVPDGGNPQEDVPPQERDDEDRGDDAEGAQVVAFPGTSSPVNDAGGPRPHPAATSRREALTLIEAVGAYYRTAEPSSPIPLLTDRACGLAQRDFLGLLKDVLSDQLRSSDTED
ncbi:type VI secretion system protein ImpA [Chelatococcus caeni]|uniref:Type VI secretion system protein ImpA n=1 Tax=Chelatococcus caeni TaxID=1348468 RepID=A0A840C2Y0_9HYPH|nr:type VI secretion system ImpA family N-terminal domain-containing protein [Chelatococcus caeni]MBB4019875.1 type VI secretion system protein ImpA [Chelatococcus caeni]